MKISILWIAVVSFILTSCAVVGSPLSGILVNAVNYPISVTSNSESSKTGRSSAVSILGLIAVGDASIETATRNAGIKHIRNVDAHVISVFGIFAKYETVVSGD